MHVVLESSSIGKTYITLSIFPLHCTTFSIIAPHIRDGYILLFIYLPIALGEKFVPYIDKIVNFVSL